MLEYLNCSAQWEAPFQAALEQAALGQDGEIEFQTMDQQETWIQLRMEPLPNNEEATAIGTIRDVTDEVKERHRREDAAKLLDRMTEGTIAGLEIGLETDRFRLLWGTQVYQDMLKDMAKKLGKDLPSYSVFIHDYIAPTIHPRDRKAYQRSMDRTTLLSLMLSEGPGPHAGVSGDDRPDPRLRVARGGVLFLPGPCDPQGYVQCLHPPGDGGQEAAAGGKTPVGRKGACPLFAGQKAGGV